MRNLFFLCIHVLTCCSTIVPSQAADEPRIDRESITAHWFNDDSCFWYENKRLNGGHEFIVVDARKGTRAAAFDQQRLAAALSQQLDDKILPEQLPVKSLAFLPDGQIRLSGAKGDWVLNLADYALVSEQPDVSSKPESLGFSRRLRRSRRTGQETEIRFSNQRDKLVNLFWIDSTGERVSYGQLQPGQSRAQHTFAGHIWLITADDDEIIAVFEAISDPSDAIIDDRDPDIRQRPARRDRGPNRRGSKSPDANWTVESRDHNLWLQAKDKPAIQLTTNGTAENSWQRDISRARGVQMRYSLTDDGSRAADVFWSPDSQRFVAVRTKSAPERRVHLIESSPSDQTQPRLHSYPYLKPGDDIPIQQLGLFHAGDGKYIELDNQLFSNPFSIRDIRWAPDCASFTFQYNQRGHQVYRVIRVDAESGEVTPIVDEQCETFFDYAGKLHVSFLDETNELIWMSERDGWNHLYLIDSSSGEVKSQITQGPWVVRGVDRIDVDKRQVWFRAGGIHAGQDPYHVHFARVDFDGSNLVLLTDSDGTHEVEYSPNGEFLIDKWSRVDWRQSMNCVARPTAVWSANWSDRTSASLPPVASGCHRDLWPRAVTARPIFSELFTGPGALIPTNHTRSSRTSMPVRIALTCLKRFGGPIVISRKSPTEDSS